jgi:hypothetical protein
VDPRRVALYELRVDGARAEYSSRFLWDRFIVENKLLGYSKTTLETSVKDEFTITVSEAIYLLRHTSSLKCSDTLPECEISRAYGYLREQG